MGNRKPHLNDVVLYVDSVATEHHGEAAGLIEHAPAIGNITKLDSQEIKHKDKLESTKKKLA